MGKNGKMAAAVAIVICIMAGGVFCGCGQTSSRQKQEEIECDYTVVATRDCPEEFL